MAGVLQHHVPMKLSLSILAFALLFTSIAAAEPKVYSTVKMSIELPDKWKSKDAKNGITMVGAPADDAGLIIFPATAPTPEGIQKATDDLLASMKLTAIAWDKDLIKDTINGLPTFARKGTASDGKKPMDLAVVLVMNDKSGLVLIAVIDHTKKDAYKSVIGTSVASIKATK